MELALGTVQFGLAYGIAGRSEPVPEPEVRSILEDAAAQGVRTLDTAAAYGDIELRLAKLAHGLPLGFVSKIPPLDEQLSPQEAASAALAAARLSRERLGPALRCLMLHRARDLRGARGAALWRVLAPWAREEGVVLGASCYSPAEAAGLAQTPGIRLFQLPGNAFDQRLAAEADNAELNGVEIYLRSAFLQGLLLMDQHRAAERVPAAAAALELWHAWAAARELSLLEAALAVVKSFGLARTVVVGVDSLQQWRAISAAWKGTQALVAPELALQEAAVIDPRTWSLAA